MKKRIPALRVLPLLILPLFMFASCKVLGLQKEHLQECKCGTPEHDLHGCTAECRVHEEHCENPLCICVDDVPDQPKEATSEGEKKK